MSIDFNLPNDNPFPGLRPFQENEQHLFFGRESQIDAMVDKLAANRFLAVVGTSGSGKSSLVNCGLRPALQAGLMASAGTSWRMAQMRPGGDPLTSLSRALAEEGVLFNNRQTEGMSLEDIVDTTLRMGKLGLVDIVEQASLADGVNLLLVVDQFEELFRYQHLGIGHDDQGAAVTEQASAFVNLLLAALEQSTQPIYVVLTMRSDFLGDCAQFNGLAEAINSGQYLVPRLSREQRRAAITGPIGVGGGKIDPVLLTRLVNDVGDNPDQLSILQHALNRTWAYWKNNKAGEGMLDLECYSSIGSMTRALDQHAEKAYAELASDQQKKICETIFKALTDKATDSRGVRRPTTLTTLCALANSVPSEVVKVIDVFRKPSRSFLMPPAGVALSPETVIDISHESLMRVWRRLDHWANEEADDARQYRRLVETAALFQQEDAGLLRDPDLRVALHWRARNNPNETWAKRYSPAYADAMAFLKKSEKSDLKRRRIRSGLITAALLLPVGVGAFLLEKQVNKQIEMKAVKKAEKQISKVEEAAEKEITKVEEEAEKQITKVEKAAEKQIIKAEEKAKELETTVDEQQDAIKITENLAVVELVDTAVLSLTDEDKIVANNLVGKLLERTRIIEQVYSDLQKKRDRLKSNETAVADKVALFNEDSSASLKKLTTSIDGDAGFEQSAEEIAKLREISRQLDNANYKVIELQIEKIERDTHNALSDIAKVKLEIEALNPNASSNNSTKKEPVNAAKAQAKKHKAAKVKAHPLVESPVEISQSAMTASLSSSSSQSLVSTAEVADGFTICENVSKLEPQNCLSDSESFRPGRLYVFARVITPPETEETLTLQWISNGKLIGEKNMTVKYNPKGYRTYSWKTFDSGNYSACLLDQKGNKIGCREFSVKNSDSGNTITSELAAIATDANTPEPESNAANEMASDTLAGGNSNDNDQTANLTDTEMRTPSVTVQTNVESVSGTRLADARGDGFVVCSNVENLEPQGCSDEFSTGKVFIFARVVTELDTETITLNWSKDGNPLATKQLDVQRNPAGYRIHSWKSLSQGSYKACLSDQLGNEIKCVPFKVN